MRALIGSLFLTLGCAGSPVMAPAPPSPDTPPPSTAPALAPIDRSKLPTPSAAPTFKAPTVSVFALSNGLTVWYAKETQAPLVSIRLVLPRGAATDPVGKAGLTQLTADLLDEGAGALDALALSDTLQRLATDFGASITTDGLLLSMDLLAAQLEPSVKLLADIVRRPRLPKDEFERRKTIKLAQAIAAEADPTSVRVVVGRRALYGQGYGGTVPQGTKASLKGLTHADVLKHYRAVVRPEGAVVVVVGAVEEPEIKRILEANFGDWRGPEGPAKSSGHPTLPASAAPVAPASLKASNKPQAIYLIDFPGSAQSSVALIRRAEGLNAPDQFAADVFNYALGGAFTSRLNLNLREDKGYTYGARSMVTRWQKAGIYALAANVQASATRATVDEMLAELAAVRGPRPLTTEERDQAVGSFLLGYPSEFEGISGVASIYAQTALDGRAPQWVADWPAQVGAVTHAQATAAGQALAEPSQFFVIIAGDRAAVEPKLTELGIPIIHTDAEGKVQRR